MELPFGIRSRWVTALAAWVLAWGIYVVFMMIAAFDGLGFLIMMPIGGAVLVTVLMAVMLLAGLLLRLPSIRLRWTWPGAVRVLSVACCMTACLIPVSFVIGSGSEGNEVELSTFWRTAFLIGFAGYLTLVFTVANWPLDARDDA